MQRGSICTAAFPGEYGKPRPAVVVQSNLFKAIDSLTLCPITSHIINSPLFRYTLVPNDANGLKQISQVMIDKLSSIPKNRIDQHIGELSKHEMDEVDQALKRWLDLE